MNYTYIVTAKPELVSLFTEAFTSTLERVGFARVVSVGRGEGVQEFRKGKDILSVDVDTAEHGEERVTVESHTMNADRLIVTAVRGMTMELLSVFLQPLVKAVPVDFPEKLDALLKELGLETREG